MKYAIDSFSGTAQEYLDYLNMTGFQEDTYGLKLAYKLDGELA